MAREKQVHENTVGLRCQFFCVFGSKHSENTFRIVHILFMQFVELEITHLINFQGKQTSRENVNAMGQQ